MRIKKVSQTTTQAQVINNRSTSTIDSYSCNYVNGINTYSTDETVCGTWLGKPLYRKCYKQTGNLTNIETGLLDVDDVINLVVMIKGSGTNGMWRTIPWCFNSNTYEPSYTGGAYFKPDTGLIGFQAGSGLTTNSKSIIIFEYTKTTD